jgi:hypothetical protein
MRSGIISAALLFAFLLAAAPAWAASYPFNTDWYTVPIGIDPLETNFTISTAEELAGLAWLANSGFSFSNKTITLARNIPLDDYDGTWPGIGSGYNSFNGTFDGAGYAITNLQSTYNAYEGGALFGTIATGATVTNVKLTGVSIINSSDWTAALAAHNNGSIENCTVTGSVSGASQVAGLVAINAGYIVNCKVTGSVSGTDNVGGLVAMNYGLGFGTPPGTLKNCVSEADVSGNNAVGGLAGGNHGIIQDSVATGSVNGNASVGGLAGYNSGGSIIGSTSGGDVTGNSNVGALVGYNDISGTITNSNVYDDVTVTDGSGSHTVDPGNIVGDNQNTGGTTGVVTTPRPAAPPAGGSPGTPETPETPETPQQPAPPQNDPGNPSGPSDEGESGGGGCDGGFSGAGAVLLAGIAAFTRRKR